MPPKQEFEFAEVLVDRLVLESFANEQSAYHQGEKALPVRPNLDRLRNKLLWHINHSLSPRQKEVLKFYLTGKKEREIALNLGIKQQVVNIYKHRAIKKLQRILAS
jgi:DNA-binding NarL/FixJ family response regulator